MNNSNYMTREAILEELMTITAGSNPKSKTGKALRNLLEKSNEPYLKPNPVLENEITQALIHNPGGFTYNELAQYLERGDQVQLIRMTVKAMGSEITRTPHPTRKGAFGKKPFILTLSEEP